MSYFDHHATTPLGAAARAAMLEALERESANPSSVHGAGRQARAEIERARARVAASVGAFPRDLIFTSGGTEALHLATRGGGADGVDVALVDPGAHPALWEACVALGCPVERLAPRDGVIDVDALAARLATGVRALVATTWVQHETGAIAPMHALREIVAAHPARWVVDAVQAWGKVPVDVGTLGASAVAFSAHKIGGPTGVGAVWSAPGATLSAIQRGGAQERGLRAGTENLVGIIGMGAASAHAHERLASMPRVAGQRDRIEGALIALGGVMVNRAPERVATACHVSVRGAAGEELVAALDLEGFCVSSGPACSSGRPGPSAAMLALYPDEPWRAASALRVTLGPETRDTDVDALVAALGIVIPRVRSS